MQRIVNWDAALTRWAGEQVGRPFAWGETDCASLVRGALAAMYGEDLVDLPPWTSARAAARALAAVGSVPAALAQLGAEEIPRAFLTQGDLAYEPRVPAGELAGSLFVAVAGRLLSSRLDGIVELIALSALPATALCYRMPHVRG